MNDLLLNFADGRLSFRGAQVDIIDLNFTVMAS